MASCINACANQETTVSEIKDAISKYVCFDMYLGAGPEFYARGQQAKIVWTVSSGDGFSAQSADLKMTSAGKGRTVAEDMTFVGRLKDGRAIISDYMSTSAYQISKKIEKQSMPQVSSNSGEFAIDVPETCVPKIQRITSNKQKTIDAMKVGLAQDLEYYNEHTGAHYSKQTLIRIVDFNSDFPYTLMYIPQTDEIYQINLPSDDASISAGEFDIGTLNYWGKGKNRPVLLKKILENSISIDLHLSSSRYSK